MRLAVDRLRRSKLPNKDQTIVVHRIAYLLMLVLPTLVVGYWLYAVLVSYPAFYFNALRPHLILNTYEPIENIIRLSITNWHHSLLTTGALLILLVGSWTVGWVLLHSYEVL